MVIMAEKRTYTSHLRKMSSTVLGCCDEDLRGKVRNRADFDYLESYGDTLGLLKAIKQEGYGMQSAEYAPVAYHQVRSSSTALSRAETVTVTPCRTTWSITMSWLI